MDDIERAPAWQQCEIDGLPEIFRKAQADEETAPWRGCWPIQWVRAPEALEKFTAAQERHGKLQARREALMRLMFDAGK